MYNVVTNKLRASKVSHCISLNKNKSKKRLFSGSSGREVVQCRMAPSLSTPCCKPVFALWAG